MTGMDRRLAEAARLGFTSAVVPAGTTPVKGLELLEVATISQALSTLLKIAVRRAGKAPEVKPPARPDLKVVDRYPPPPDTGDNDRS